MDRKYELVKEDSQYIDGHTLYRIRALKDFNDVKVGDLGGYIEKQYNLTHKGNAWIYDVNCCVYGHAKVSGNAQIRDAVNIHDYCTVSGEARINGTAFIHGNTDISGFVHIGNDVEITGDAQICGDACIGGDIRIIGDIFIGGKALILYPKDYMIFTHVLKEYDTLGFMRTQDGSINVSYNQKLYTLTEFRQYLKTLQNNSLILKRYSLILKLMKLHFGIIGGEEEQ